MDQFMGIVENNTCLNGFTKDNITSHSAYLKQQQSDVNVPCWRNLGKLRNGAADWH